jgi:hypothetical protein
MRAQQRTSAAGSSRSQASGWLLRLTLMASLLASLAQFWLVPPSALAAPIELTPISHDFGSVQVGAQSATQTFTLSNNNPSQLTVGTVTITGGNSGDFAKVLDSCTNRTIPIEGSCTFTLRFQPTATGPRSSTVSLETTADTYTATLTGTGTVAASLTVTPDAISFGSQETGTTSAAQLVTVRNNGGAAIQISGTSIAGANFATSGDQCSGTTLQPTEECTVGVTFSPTATGPASGTLTIASDAPEGPREVALSGTGSDPPVGAIAVTPGSHSFSGRAIGTTSGAQSFTVAHTGGGPVALGAITIADDGLMRGMSVTPGSIDFGAQATGVPSAPRAISITNAESAALLLGAITLGGANAGEYMLVGDACGGATLLPGQGCSVGVVYLPTGAGASAATVTIPYNAAGGSYVVGLAGNGGAAVDGGIVTPEAVAEFALVDNTCLAARLEAGETCTFGVTFAPATEDERAATLSIASDAGNGPHSVALDGTGQVGATPLLLFTPLLLDFGDRPIGGSAAPRSVTVTNTGGAELAITGVSLGGAAASGFTIAAGDDECSGVTLAVGQSCVVLVGFSPATTGRYNATLVFTDDAPGGQRVVALTGNAVTPPAPVAWLSTGEVSFGSHVVGTTSAAQTITVRNDGDAALAIAAVAIGGVSGGQFALGSNHCAGATLAPDATCTFDVSFAPTNTGPSGATVSVTSNASSSPDTIALSGTGLPPPAPAVALSTTGLDFGNQQIGTTSGARPVTLTNIGTAPLAIAAITASGDFAQTHDCPASLAAEASCTISVTFTPTATGEREGALSIASDAASSPDRVALDGAGTAPPVPVVALSTTSLDFGAQQTGTSSAPQSITITNSGDGTLNLGTLSLGGAADQFAIVANGCLGASLGHDESCSFGVTFTPTGNGHQSATVSIPSNAASSPESVALDGTGTEPSFSVAPDVLDFGSHPVGVTSAQQSVTVTNTGNGPVAPGAGLVSGPGFAVVADACASVTLAPQETCAITLTFTPTAIGPASGALMVGSQAVTLDGSGTNAPIATTLGVPDVGGSYGGTVTLRATLRNSGNSAPLPGKLIAFTVGGAAVGTATTDSSGTATLPDVALGARGAGSYASAVGASFAGDGGALPSSGTALLTVARAPLTVVADNQRRDYGFANPALSVSYLGFVNADTSAVLTGRPTLSTTATAASAVGTYPIVVARNTLNSPNYDFAFASGTLTVAPTVLTIAAVDKTRVYGAANPALTVRYSGFRQGDTATDLVGAPSLTTQATPASPAGIYSITVGRGTLASSNYSFVLVNGTLTVTPANVALSAVSGAATYGGTATLTATLRQTNGAAAPIAGATITFTLGGTAVGSAMTDAGGVATLTNVALGGRGAGTYNNLVRASFAGNSNQAGDTTPGVLRVAKATLVLRAVDQTRRVGVDNPPCQVQLAPGSSFVNGDTFASLNLSDLACSYGGANRRSPAGTYTLTPRGVRSDNYAISYQSGTLTIVP